MAKRRKKTAAKSMAFSTKKLIKEKARKYPIIKCLYTPNWESKGLCQVFIVRKQSSGKYLYGLYFLDTWCLGLADVIYEANLSEEDLVEMEEKITGDNEHSFTECDYVKAHNLVYGVIAYAEDLGLYPHSDFNIAKYILEEDDEAIELIEFEFGSEGGRPHYFASPNENYKRIISILNRTIGRGNYDYTPPFEL